MHIQWMDLHPIKVWVPIVTLILAVIAWYNWRTLEAARQLWSDLIIEDAFSPASRRRRLMLWLEWIVFAVVLVVALGGPNFARAPMMVAKGSVQLISIHDVSPSQAAEDTRPFFAEMSGEDDKGVDFAWGTRLDVAKWYLRNDLMPQLAFNQAGIITLEGAGHVMWPITNDLSPSSAFYYMLKNYVQVGAAPGGGCNYSSGFQSALDEFSRLRKHEEAAGDKSQKIRFIVLFTDGGFTGNLAELDDALDRLKEEHIHLLTVVTGGTTPVPVPKYDPSNHRRNGRYYPGMTKVDEVKSTEIIRAGYPVQGELKPKENIFVHIKDRAKDSDLIFAPPGTAHIHYSFPQKAGGLYAQSLQSNLKHVLLLLDVLLFLLITTGGGGLPRWTLFVANLRPVIGAVIWFSSRFRKRTE